MVIAFSDVGKSINNLASALSQGMTITHNFSGDMSLAFSIQNQDQLKNAVADAIQPKIEKIIGDEINRRLDEFQAGG
jgi:L-2-hydroxyglutarate oxidase LhgO